MSEKWVHITDAAQKALKVGELVATRTYRITDKHLRKYALSLRETNPLYWDNDFAAREGRFGKRALPSSYVVVLNPMEGGGGQGGVIPASAFWGQIWDKPDNGRLWGGHAAYNEYECFKPMFLGDTITCEVRNRRCYEKRGKAGILVCAETEYKLTNQDGEHVATGVYGVMSTMPFERKAATVEAGAAVQA